MPELQVGTWITGYPEKNTIELFIDVVEMAIEYGYDILIDVWEADKPVFLTGEPTDEMIEDLAILADFAAQYIEEQLPEGYELDLNPEGLVLRKLEKN